MNLLNIQDNKNVDYIEFIRQNNNLEHLLTWQQTGEGRFNVVNNEAGFSKSRLTDKIIAKGDLIRTILVKKYNSEKLQSLENMKEAMVDELDIDICKNAILVNAENSREYETQKQNELVRANNIIISHEKYRLLSEDDKLYLYTKNRDTLIIDEYVDVPIAKVSRGIINVHRLLFPIKCGKGIYDELENSFYDMLCLLESRKDSIGNMIIYKLKKTWL